jgi:chromosome segregation ATPase
MFEKKKISKVEKENESLCFQKKGLEKELEELSTNINKYYEQVGKIIISEGIVTENEKIDINLKNKIYESQQECQKIKSNIEKLDSDMEDNNDRILGYKGKVKCEKCGKIVDYKSDERFCPKCGLKLKEPKK